ncbi:MAG TPA: zf-HC2 domain-containing protein, partial [Pyrinomonadaceae bacterium]
MNKEVTCETVCVAAMANADGVQPPLPLAEIEAHLAHCAGCRREVEQLETLSGLLGSRKRSLRPEDLWAGIENRLTAFAAAREPFAVSATFVLLGLLLVAYRLVEMIPERALGWSFKLVPLLAAVAAFVYL